MSMEAKLGRSRLFWQISAPLAVLLRFSSRAVLVKSR